MSHNFYFLQACEKFYALYSIYTYTICITLLLILESYLKTGADKATGTQNSYTNKKMKELI